MARRYKYAGELAEKLMPVVQVVNLDPLWIEFDCPIEFENQVTVSREVLVWPAARPAGPHFLRTRTMPSK